ncbi:MULTISPECIES: hypothetical protein [unclassified Ruegeria]|uniref:hypothetical protein n=1 Tax=unclassified Ruegeria TaxID=2625375 RepID=UPI00149263BB|nr:MULTISPECIES: hypothetical protein [unclassified Ruegeria]NOD37110.1 hypothetical protein [Ruegeria sp. HKCCD7296]NOE44285.1 hypothetical protein [Ruegeria sp. HKCCD7319]
MSRYPVTPPADAVLLTEHQKAAELQLSLSFLRKDRLRENPKIPFVKIGGSVRYHREQPMPVTPDGL